MKKKSGSTKLFRSVLVLMVSLIFCLQTAFPVLAVTVNPLGSPLPSKEEYSMDNSSLIPAILPASEVTVDSNYTPDWLSDLMLIEMRLETALKGGLSNDSQDGLSAEATALIDHVAELGVNGLWFTPIFSYTAHSGYGIADYDTINDNITGIPGATPEKSREIFRMFVDYAHSRNIRIFIDMVVWGTDKRHPWVDIAETDSPDDSAYYKTTKEGGTYSLEDSIWGGWSFDWSKPAVVTKYTELAKGLVADLDIDGFRCDLEPYTSVNGSETIRNGKMWEDIQKDLWEDEDKSIAIFSELPSRRRSSFDFGQLDVHSSVDDDGKLSNMAHGSQDYYLRPGINIVDSVKSGVGIGRPTEVGKTGSGNFKYYANGISIHDSGVLPSTRFEYIAKRNPIVLGYQGIFAPFIPLWFMGEEFDNAMGRNNSSVLYFSEYDPSLIDETTGNRQFLEATKAQIRVRRLYSEIFSYFADNHRDANITKVDTTNLDLQAYARFAEGKGIMVIANNQNDKVYSDVTIPYAEMGLTAENYRLVDLLNGDIILANGKRSELTSVNVDVLSQDMRILLVEEDTDAPVGSKAKEGWEEGLPTVKLPDAPRGWVNRGAQFNDVGYWDDSPNKPIYTESENGVRITSKAGTRTMFLRDMRLDTLTLKLKVDSKMVIYLYNNYDNAINKDYLDDNMLTLIVDPQATKTLFLIGYGKQTSPDNQFELLNVEVPVVLGNTNDMTLNIRKSGDNWIFSMNGNEYSLTNAAVTKDTQGLSDLSKIKVGLGGWSQKFDFTVKQIFNGAEVQVLDILEREIAVSASSSEAGIVTGGGKVVHGQNHTVTASANSGYKFVSWTENGEVVSTDASYTFVIDENRVLVANFEIDDTPTTTQAPDGETTAAPTQGETTAKNPPVTGETTYLPITLGVLIVAATAAAYLQYLKKKKG